MEANQIASNIGPCAGCKFLRRKCQADCIFAPHFPSDQIQKFQTMHRVFGASNISKMLQDIHPNNREDAVNSLAYEAEMRQLYPIYGCIGIVTQLHNQLKQLRADLLLTKTELVKYQIQGLANHNLLSTATTSAANVNTYNCMLYPSLQQQQQQQNIGMNFMDMSTCNVGRDQFDRANDFNAENVYGMNEMIGFDRANNYNAENVYGMNGMIGGQVEMFEYPINSVPTTIINSDISQSLYTFNSYDISSHI